MAFTSSIQGIPEIFEG